MAAIEVHTTLRGDRAGEHVVGCSGPGRYQLALRGEQAFDGELALREGADIAEALFAPPQHGVPVTLAEGETLEIVLRREVADAHMRHLPAQLRAAVRRGGRVRARGRARARGGRRDRRRRHHAPRSRARASTARRWRCPAARTSSCGASTRRSRARSSWSTPARRCCCRGSTRSRASCCAGSRARRRATRSPTSCFGAAEPGGRLPMTWPASEDGLPSVTPVDGVLPYDEGLAIGYRGRRRAAAAVRPRPRLHELGVPGDGRRDACG